jgi:hypothetical protein
MVRLILLILSPLFFLLAQSQILAIDYGTQFIKAALVNAGAGKSFSIVENPKSQRKFINSVTICLFRWEFTMKRDFMRLRHFPKGQEGRPIASSFLDFWSTSIITPLSFRGLKRNSFCNISIILKVTSCWHSLS